MSKGGFLGGIVVGAALAIVGNYLLNTEEGKETRRKVKAEVDKLRDELKSKLKNEEEPLDESEETI